MNSGAEIARQLAAAGAAIVVNYASDRDREEKVVADIAGAGGRAVAVEGNVARSADVDRIFAQAKSTFGTVGILVNSAGTYRFGTIEEAQKRSFTGTSTPTCLACCSRPRRPSPSLASPLTYVALDQCG